MATTALNDDQVRQEMFKMVNFIKQEAKDKSNEILARGNEEYSIEKANLVQQEKLKINAQHERRLKQVEVQKRISYSNRLNQSRLKVLQAREQTVDSLFAEAKQRLSQLTANKDKYKALLESLVLQVRPRRAGRGGSAQKNSLLGVMAHARFAGPPPLRARARARYQGLFQLMETDVVVYARKSDVDLVKSVLAGAASRYEKESKVKVTITVDPQTFVSEEVSGGVEMSANEGRIRCVNTLDSRLAQLQQAMLPDIRNILFGANENRAFFN